VPDDRGLYQTWEKPLFRPPLCETCGSPTRTSWVVVEPAGEAPGGWQPASFTCLQLTGQHPSPERRPHVPERRQHR
jgi:hypothetical protein